MKTIPDNEPVTPTLPTTITPAATEFLTYAEELRGWLGDLAGESEEERAASEPGWKAKGSKREESNVRD